MRLLPISVDDSFDVNASHFQGVW